MHPRSRTCASTGPPRCSRSGPDATQRHPVRNLARRLGTRGCAAAGPPA
jgi:hypothetical protein